MRADSHPHSAERFLQSVQTRTGKQSYCSSNTETDYFWDPPHEGRSTCCFSLTPSIDPTGQSLYPTGINKKVYPRCLVFINGQKGQNPRNKHFWNTWKKLRRRTENAWVSPPKVQTRLRRLRLFCQHWQARARNVWITWILRNFISSNKRKKIITNHVQPWTINVSVVTLRINIRFVFWSVHSNALW